MTSHDPTEVGDATEVGDPSVSGRTDSSRTGPLREPARVPQPGDVIAHFTVLDTLGVGGMGMVLRVHDEHLDRTVALKLVRPEFGRHETRTHGTERLLIEARAMAKITHPNVITVHEVGVVDGQVFLAMEYIDGQTLEQWVDAGPHRWTHVLDRWLAAGRGLAAAHAANLVHRDFKPANVLVGRDGRTLVTDFGIAGRLDDDALELEPSEHAEPGPAREELDTDDLARLTGRLSQRLTAVGSLLGTPRYMAPEQFVGGPVDARADQFAFCVSLWEALYGSHPFESSNVAALALAASTGQIREPPRGRGVPDRLRRILVRGLSPKPERRWPDVATLLHEIEQLRRRIERRRVVVPGVLAAAAIGVVAWLSWPDPPAPPDPCQPPSAGNWAGVWDDATQREIEAAFASTELLPYVRESWPRVRARLDAYTTSWDEHQVEACRDTRVRELVSEQLLDRRMSCLDGHARRVAALTTKLRAADADVLSHALETVWRLPELDECDDLARLESETPTPPEHLREQLAALDEALATAATLDAAVRGDLAAEHLQPWIEQVAGHGYPIAEAQLHRALGNAWSNRDDSRSCEHFRRSYVRAIAADAVDFASHTAQQIAECEADAQQLAATDLWMEVAAAGYEQLGNEFDAFYHAKWSYIWRSRGDLPKAEQAIRRAIELAAAEGNAMLHATTEANLGALLAEQRKLGEARTQLARAVELATGLLGPNHPTTLKWQGNQVALLAMEGKDFARVVREAEPLLAAQEAGLGPDADVLAVTLTIMGMALRQLDDIERATECDARALAIREKVYGPKHWLTLESLEKLGRDHVAAKDYEQGVAELRRVLELTTEIRGGEHKDVGRAWGTLGWALYESDRLDEALDAHRRGLAILIAAVGEDHHNAIEASAELGAALVTAKQWREAEPLLRRVLEFADQISFPPRHRANAMLNLAKTRRALAPREREAITLAEQALALLAEDRKAPIYAKIEAWLAEQRR